MGTITDLLRRSHDDRAAEDELYRAVYDDLKRRARFCLGKEAAGADLGPTELVHEVYVKLVRGDDPSWADRDHFFGVAANAMRQILVDAARRRKAQKRGGGRPQFPLDEAETLSEETASEVLAVEDFLLEQPGLSTLEARVVQLHYFGGLSFEEIAGRLGRETGTPWSTADVSRRWDYVRAVLRKRMRERRVEN